MAVTGPGMHRQLIEGFKLIQQRMENVRRSIDHFDDERGDLGESRQDALLDLAKHYLPELNAGAIDATWSEVRESLNQVLMRREDELRRCRAAIDGLKDRQAIEEDRLLKINEELDQETERRDRLSANVQHELASDATFAQLSAQAAAAEAALERAEANLNEIEQDAARKLPSYQESTLFNYLNERGFGTEQYGSRGFTRRMDRWLAKYIDYPKAKKGYDFLVNTPEQMRKIIANDRDAMETVMEALEGQRDEVVRRSGLPDAIDRTQQLNDQREKQLTTLDQISADLTQLLDQLNELEDPRGPYYQEAIDVFRSTLAALDSDDLDRRAKQTVELTDDHIVARIQGIDTDLEKLSDEHRQSQTDVRELQRCLDSYGRMMQRFRAAKYDAARSHFSDDVDVFGMIDRASCESDIDELWKALRASQKWGPTFGQQVESVATHPMTSLLVGAMAEAAGALNQQAMRAARRRNRDYGRGRNNRRY
ncbi:hypothetical protein LOC67_25015 [Stieleria sp. JC731]|uniref:hypothetical protein n=1 Tax=Pirellulaceae TaxID=2691357 RepID=UPI001E5F6792|nr:hypothetical protein [Stieleria sp. JC731]MCC9603825.1 hypothetical protein [Stieleria sp. JC731]